MVSVNRSIFIGDSLYQKLLILVQLCWRYLKISQVSGFFRHIVHLQLLGVVLTLLVLHLF